MLKGIFLVGVVVVSSFSDLISIYLVFVFSMLGLGRCLEGYGDELDVIFIFRVEVGVRLWGFG